MRQERALSMWHLGNSVGSKWLPAFAVSLLSVSVVMSVLAAGNAENASRPSSICSLQFEGVLLENLPQAKTASQMEHGLSGLQNVGTGMLFTWTDDEPRVFWMRGTPTPLSIAFIDKTGSVFQIEDMEPNTTALHWSTLPAREGLEVKQGDFQRLGITVGSRVIDRTCKSIN